jgi:hypothetical protein
MWERTHEALETPLGGAGANSLRKKLRALS